MIRQERGSSLLLVLFMIVIFMMLGMAVLSASLGGAGRSEVRESDVQSLHLAEKALNEAVAYLVAKFDTYHSFTPEKIDSILDEFGDEMEDRKRNNGGELIIGTELSSVKKPVGRITGFSDGTRIDDNTYQIDIYAEGVVNGVTRKLTQAVTLDTYPDFLRYALGSEGDVFLNGAPKINGNIYSGKNLKIKNEANYSYNNQQSQEFQYLSTLYPLLNGIAYVQNLTKVFYCRALYCNTNVESNYNSMSLSGDNNAFNSQKILGITTDKIIPKDQGKFVPIDIDESFIDKVAEAVGVRDADRGNINSTTSFDGLMTYLIAAYGPASTVEPHRINVIVPPISPIDENDPGIGDYHAALIPINEELKNLTSSTIYQGDLNLDGINLKQLLYNESDKNDRYRFPRNTLDPTAPYKSNWLIVNGDLNIINENSAAIQVRGNILVKGEIYIRGKVDFDATIFSLKSQGVLNSLKDSTTTIEDAEIRGLIGADGARKQLVLISKGKILINRVEAFKPAIPYDATNSKVLQAYFYTDDSAILFGVGSTFWIRGGFFAKKELVINAVLGTTRATGNSITVDSGTEDRTLPRLVIDYNNDFFTDQRAGLPRVNHVNVVIGKKTFVK
ncbi:hypothetical protein EHS13_18315 [Paenibacillus psychroresistens]|uniref:Uncharacterized protein n=1 Tax=Paenibacillus psychroresistens TaxID=1778678 RepID=A0A6B8RLR1_9BACL|nr:hypothetical protein [Paenibacillus psychroresistens]QGQ96694.1 hypothetical protein EHS13_18315 [Paenibacillus psychroresistens]